VLYICVTQKQTTLLFHLLILNIMSNATNKTALDRVKAHYKQELFEYQTGSSFFCKEDHRNRLSAIEEVLIYCFSLQREDIIQLKKEVARRILRLKK
jgi:hypothetical protein